MTYKTVAAKYSRIIKDAIAAGDDYLAAEYEDKLRDVEFTMWAATR